jgi:ABC-type sugar transport system substrate-binding protein
MVARGQVDGELLWNPWEGFFVKPDGTPYKIAYTCSTLEVEPMAQAVKMLEDWFPRFGLGEKGGNWTTFGAGFNLDAQINWFEDMMTTFEPDWIMCHSVSAELEIPVVEKSVYEEGIPVFTLDCGVDTDAVTSFIAHKFEGPGGTDVLAEWLVADFERRGFGPDNPAVVGELWGMREMSTAQLRHEGFHSVIDDYDWISVIESADTDWAEEKTATITADMVMAHPEIDAVFHHGCGGAGMVPGLESIGMLLPLDDPDHIIIVSNDAEIAMWDAVAEGRADTFSTHGGVEPSDICLQVAMTSVILGQPVEKFYQCPFYMVDASNIETIQIGGVPPYPGLPRGRWDTWVPANPADDYGFPQPSFELREMYQGY